MPHRRPAPLTRLACCALVLLAACQQPKQPEVDVEVLHTEPPSSVTSNCPALAADWLAALPTQSRRIEPAHCSSHVGTPLFAWGHAADRLAGSPYQLTVRPVGGAAVQNLAGLTEPRARLTAALSAGEYEWAVIHAGASGSQQSTQWRRFTVTAADGQVRAQDLVDGTQLAAQIAARARPRSFTAGISAEALRTFAQQPEHLPALTLLRARANAATSAAVAATAPGLDTSTALTRAQSLATLVQAARSERQSVEALSLVAKLDANANLLAAAKRRLLALAGWPSNGSSGEASSSAANAETSLALAQGLDLLWNDLSAAERSQVSVALRDRLQQAANGWALLDREPFAAAVQSNLRLHLQALLLAAGAFPEAQTLLARAWELHRHQLYLWGFDGNHGSAVAQSWQQFAAQTTAAAAVRVVAGVNLYDLSVIRRSAEPLLALTAPGAALAAPFGDEAETRNLYDRHSAALRLHAQQSRDLASIWYWQAKATNVSSPQDASIWQLLLLGINRQDLPVGSATLANDWYSPQAGLAALHSDIRRADRSSVFFRSSRHGAYGAAQAEQNAIVFVSQGQPLLVNAGTTPFAGSAHHRHTRASRYKNTLSVDGGFGQAESTVGAVRPTDPLFNMDAAGSLTRTQSAGAYAAVTGDATAAYRAVDPARNVWVPLLSNAVRSVVMDKANGLVFVYDWATSSQARQWELNWHSPNAFSADASTVRASSGNASVCLDRHGPATQFSQTQAWPVAPEVAAPAPASARFSTLARSLEFAHLTVLREGCRTVPLQVTQNGAQISVLINGRDTLQFDRRALSLPTAAAGAATEAPTVRASSSSATTPSAAASTTASSASTPSATSSATVAGAPCKVETWRSFGTSCRTIAALRMADGETISFSNVAEGYMGQIIGSCKNGTLEWGKFSCATTDTGGASARSATSQADASPPLLAAKPTLVTRPPFKVSHRSGTFNVTLAPYPVKSEAARSHDLVQALLDPQTRRPNALSVQVPILVGSQLQHVNLTEASSPALTAAGSPLRAELTAAGLRTAYLPNDPASSEKLRVQINSYPLPTRQNLYWDLSFKFGGSDATDVWPLTKYTTSAVLLWQLKVDPGFPSLGLLADTDPADPSRLMLTFFQRSSNVSDYSKRWTVHGIKPAEFQDVIVAANLDDRNADEGGQGSLRIWVNGRLIANETGRNLIRDLSGPHRWAFGLYQPAEANPVALRKTIVWRRARVASD